MNTTQDVLHFLPFWEKGGRSLSMTGRRICFFRLLYYFL